MKEPMVILLAVIIACDNSKSNGEDQVRADRGIMSFGTSPTSPIPIPGHPNIRVYKRGYITDTNERCAGLDIYQNIGGVNSVLYHGELKVGRLIPIGKQLYRIRSVNLDEKSLRAQVSLYELPAETKLAISRCSLILPAGVDGAFADIRKTRVRVIGSAMGNNIGIKLGTDRDESPKITIKDGEEVKIGADTFQVHVLCVDKQEFVVFSVIGEAPMERPPQPSFFR